MYGYIYETSWKNQQGQTVYYIGQHADKYVRTTQKFQESYHGSGVRVLNQINKFGKGSVDTILLEWCSSQDELNEREIYYIKQYKEQYENCCVNIDKGGSNVNYYYNTNKDYEQLKQERIAKGKKTKLERYGDENFSNREKAAETRKNNPQPAWNKNVKFTEEQKVNIKLSHNTPEFKLKQHLSHIGTKRSEEFKQHDSEYRQGAKYYNNGKEQIVIYKHQTDIQIPDDFIPGRLKLKDFHSNKGRHWYHNPENTEELMLYEQDAPEGWLLGRLPMTEEQKILISEHHNPKSNTRKKKN